MILHVPITGIEVLGTHGLIASFNFPSYTHSFLSEMLSVSSIWVIVMHVCGQYPNTCTLYIYIYIDGTSACSALYCQCLLETCYMYTRIRHTEINPDATKKRALDKVKSRISEEADVKNHIMFADERSL